MEFEKKIHDIIYPSKSIIYGVLNWGLGHATRSCPLIDYIISLNKKLTIASDGIALRFLQKRYPKIKFITLDSYNIDYRSNSLWYNTFRQGPKIWKAINSERKKLLHLSIRDDYDLIISDGRLGFRHNKVPSYLISHQITIPLKDKILSPLINYINHKNIRKFSEIWVPDFQDRILSGDMSKSSNHKVQYIGPLSRFNSKVSSNADQQKKYVIAAILSGPEPKRTELEKKIIQLFKGRKGRFLIVRGTEDQRIYNKIENIDFIPLANEAILLDIFNKAENILSRSGYSSIMDYYIMGIKAILIPTPNQPEQEYLGKLHQQSKLFTVISEKNLNKIDLTGLIT